MRLSDVDLVELLERPGNRSFSSIFFSRIVMRGQSVFRPDMEDDMILIVRSGRLRVYLAYGDKEFSLAFLGKGDIYSSHTGAYVQALTESEIMLAETHLVHRHMASVTAISSIMVRILGQMLRSSFFLIESMVFKDSNTRLAALLLEQAEGSDRNRQQPADDMSDLPDIHLELTMEQLAGLVGTTRQTASTLLNDMIRAGILQRRGRGHFVVLDMTRLREIALQ
ncbi:Crp/Fnr family transcriptional regulator [Nitratidesulfovibrio vulgaris]|uniref:Crp/Fnr family transcriptional regulator n=1 Tax=Nitratidesulfovibrio vulgaris TaxID=881 RepID=UPI0023008753|nr:Crp/Fnr family transcriptional regulator [Nitratidesulfovibrio vulgaris]WCB45620.1 Crp/Fnr family transcriptional regulator [Nitratidesulfovibrio vulgaris]